MSDEFNSEFGLFGLCPQNCCIGLVLLLTLFRVWTHFFNLLRLLIVSCSSAKICISVQVFSPIPLQIRQNLLVQLCWNEFCQSKVWLDRCWFQINGIETNYSMRLAQIEIWNDYMKGVILTSFMLRIIFILRSIN